MRTSANAFTLIELVVVITIMTALGLIAAMAIPYVKTQGQIHQTESTMHLIGIALDQFKSDKGKFPSGTGPTMILALTNPISSTSWKRASTDWFPGKSSVKDAWGKDFAYTCCDEYEASGRGVEVHATKKDYYNSLTYQLYSMGPNLKTWPNTKAGGNDRLCGTEQDDIRNWKQIIFYDTNPYPAS